MPSEILLARTKEMLRANGLKARKGLGQNFLVDGGVVKKILSAAALTEEDTVIEVGPGLGVMTGELAKAAGQVIAVELDATLAGILEAQYDGNPRVKIINADILKTDAAALAEEYGFKRYKVVANLPYYITSAAIRHFLEVSLKPEMLVLMTQKEVAKQITAAPGEMSLLSVSVQLYGKPSIVDKVPARSFHPAPGVDSAILKIEVFQPEQVGVNDIEVFFKIVRAAFSANRKQIVNPLAHRLAMPRADVLALLAKAGIDSHRRAETLTITEWKYLSQTFQNKDK